VDNRHIEGVGAPHFAESTILAEEKLHYREAGRTWFQILEFKLINTFIERF
jgi:hypothetical protein